MIDYNGMQDYSHLSTAINVMVDDPEIDVHERECALVISEYIEEDKLDAAFNDAMDGAYIEDLKDFVDCYATIHLRVYGEPIENCVSDEAFRNFPEPRYVDEERLDNVLQNVYHEDL